MSVSWPTASPTARTSSDLRKRRSQAIIASRMTPAAQCGSLQHERGGREIVMYARGRTPPGEADHRDADRRRDGDSRHSALRAWPMIFLFLQPVRRQRQWLLRLLMATSSGSSARCSAILATASTMWRKPRSREQELVGNCHLFVLAEPLGDREMELVVGGHIVEPAHGEDCSASGEKAT